MSKTNQKMSKPIIEQKWQDHVYLDATCRERFVTLQNVPQLADKNLMMAGLAELEREYYVERKGPTIHTLLFSLRGLGKLQLADGHQPIPPMSLTVLPAGHGFRFQLEPGHDWQMAWVLLEDTTRWQALRKQSQQILPTEQAEAIWSWLALLVNPFAREKRQSALVSGLAETITAGLRLETHLSLAQQRVMAVFEGVAEKLHQPWPLAQLAELSFVGEAQLNRLCHQLFGRSAHQHVMHLRMCKASELLCFSQWNLAIIAAHLGFSDAYNFSKAFRRYYGCSPRQYRQRHC